MDNLSPYDWLVVAAVAVCWSGLLVYSMLLFRWRRKDIPVRAFASAPMLWLIAPRRYFREDRIGYVWRGLFIWIVGCLIVIAIVERLPFWMIDS